MLASLLVLCLGLCLADPAVTERDPIPPPPVFNCPSLPTPPPATHVTQLRPGNVKAILALGDSISAGFAMKEYRGLVFSIGGDKYASEFSYQLALTLPNFLKHYSPDLQGQAYGETFPLTKGAYLDGGVSGAKVEDVPGQIDYLVNAANTTYAGKIDWENDWKLLTLFIACYSNRGHPEYFEQQLDAVLAKIQKDIPKVFVNLVTIFNISGVWNAGQTKKYCQILWQDLKVDECPCLMAHGPQGRQAMDANSIAYNAVSQRLAQKYSSQTTGSSTFQVVVQPGLTDFNVTHWGESFLSDLDCFHPNLLADQAFAVALWNNMFQPPGKKSTNLNPKTDTISCPTVSSVLQ